MLQNLRYSCARTARQQSKNSRMSPSWRSAFTFVELLVVIAIIGILVAVLLPAVQSAREVTRRSGCQNNLKQLGLALQSYHDAYQALPAGCTSAEDFGPSALVHLLPFLEQKAAFDQYDPQQRASDIEGTEGDLIGLARPIVLVCPSETNRREDTHLGWTNYHLNYGTYVFTEKKWDGVFGPTFAAGGASGMDRIGWRDLRDGSTHTAAFGEVCNGPDAGQKRDRRSDCFEHEGPVSLNHVSARATLRSNDWRTAPLAGDWDPAWRYRGYPWREGTVWRGGYTHLLPPNSACWRTNGDWWQTVTPASSWHTSGANVVLCDGSVRFVTESVDGNSWEAVGSRAGGEAISLP